MHPATLGFPNRGGWLSPFEQLPSAAWHKACSLSSFCRFVGRSPALSICLMMRFQIGMRRGPRCRREIKKIKSILGKCRNPAMPVRGDNAIAGSFPAPAFSSRLFFNIRAMRRETNSCQCDKIATLLRSHFPQRSPPRRDTGAESFWLISLPNQSSALSLSGAASLLRMMHLRRAKVGRAMERTLQPPHGTQPAHRCRTFHQHDGASQRCRTDRIAGHRHQQAVRDVSGQRRHRSRPVSGGNPCPARRERRRQVDAGQGHVRPHSAERRRTALDGAKDRSGRSVGGARARHRHGVPALFAVREPHGRRERRARPAAGRIVCGDLGAAGRNRPALRLAARSQARGLAAFGRRAAAHRDRARADAKSRSS